MPKKRSSAAKRQSTQLESFAEDLGRLLGTAENKARGWLDQRKAIVAQLAQLRDKTDSLLRELTEGGAKMVAAVRLARGTQRRRPLGAEKKTPQETWSPVHGRPAQRAGGTHARLLGEPQEGREEDLQEDEAWHAVSVANASTFERTPKSTKRPAVRLA